jgi:heme oxygenase
VKKKCLPTNAVAFYDFGSIANVPALKESYRKRLNLITSHLNELVTEARKSFEWHDKIFAQPVFCARHQAEKISNIPHS